MGFRAGFAIRSLTGLEASAPPGQPGHPMRSSHPGVAPRCTRILRPYASRLYTYLSISTLS